MKTKSVLDNLVIKSKGSVRYTEHIFTQRGAAPDRIETHDTTLADWIIMVAWQFGFEIDDSTDDRQKLEDAMQFITNYWSVHNPMGDLNDE
tara:strand:+ start:366 stop:638 length:273 start_codon:yes stop_codon:yes gene_type:complete